MAADWVRLIAEVESIGLRVLWINKTNGEVHCKVPEEML